MINMTLKEELNNDSIREKILSSLYDKHKKARSLNGQLMGIREIAQAVRSLEPLSKETLVASNLTFLVKNDFIEEKEIENTYAKTRYGNAKPTYKYQLTREGLAYFESGSKFDKSNIFAGIGDITGNGNYIILGNNNNISSLSNITYSEGNKLAEELRRRVNALGELTDSEKISVQSDIETIKNQLSKDDPDKEIISKAKNNLGFLADIVTIAPHVSNLFLWILENFNV